MSIFTSRNCIRYSIWGLWFALLLATPFFLSDPLSGVLYSNRYLFVSIGFLIGAISLRWSSAIALKCRTVVLMYCVGIGVTAISTIPEWVFLPFYSWSDPSDFVHYVPQDFFMLALNIQPVLLVIGSTLCIITGRSILKAPKDKSLFGSLTEERSYGANERAVLLVPAALFILGYCRVSWMGILDRSTSGFVLFDNEAILLYVLPCATLVFYVIAAQSILVSARRLSMLSKCSAKAIAPIYSWQISIFALGMICWNLTTRVVPILGCVSYWNEDSTWVRTAPPYWPELGVALSVILLIAVGGSKLRRSLSTHELESNDLSLQIEKRFLAAKLTEREIKAANLLIAGKTSAQSGIIMNIKAHTVRTYLQRAYKKLGFKSSKELIDFANSRLETDSNGADGLFEQQNTARLAQRVLSPLFVVALFLALLPHGLEGATWGSGREVLGGAAIALFLFGVFFRYRTWATDCGIIGKDSRIDCDHRLVQLLRGIAASLALIALGFSAGFSVIWPDSDASFLPFAECLFSFVLTFAFCSWRFADRYGELLSYTRSRSFYLTICIGLIAIEALMGILNERSWLVYLFLAAAIFGLSMREFLSSGNSISLKEVTQSPSAFVGSQSLLFSFCAVCFIFGFLWWVVWRNPDPFFVMLFLAGLLVPQVLYISSTQSIKKGALIALGFLFVFLIAFFLEAAAIVYIAVFMLFSAVVWAAKEKIISSKFVFDGIIMYACGCVTALVFLDIVSDILSLRSQMALSLVHSMEVFRTLIAFGSGMLFFAVFILCCWFCKTLSDQKLLIPVLEAAADKSKVQQWDSILRERGLSDTQASVATLIVQGFSSREIARRLHYAHGTVNAARAAIYKALEIHSRSELTAIFLDIPNRR